MAKRRGKHRSSVNITIVLIVIVVVAALLLLDYFGVISLPFQNPLRALFQKTEDTDDSPDVVVSGDLQIHFIELGNKYTGDCTYIKVGKDMDILIDAGSKTSSISTIESYVDKYCTDGTLEYVIVTHAHEDHYAGFAGDGKNESIFKHYKCETIIDFSQTNQKETATMYSNYQKSLAAEIAEGATHYTASEVRQSGEYVFKLTETGSITLEILDSYYYYHKDSSGENNHSVCCMINKGDEHYLFTGDLEKKGEEQLVQLNKLPEVELFKAGHHGSKTSTNEVLLSVIKPKIVCVCCCAGSGQYTNVDNNDNTFPTQAFIDRVAPYTSRVYVTTICEDFTTDATVQSMNGNIIVFSASDGVHVKCSNNNLKLKDTEWFKKHRVCPGAWSD